VTWRWSAIDHATRTHYEQRYGRSFIPPDMAVQDWPVSYKELEPYYDRFERPPGSAARPEIFRGQRQGGGNVSEAPRERDYPLPPLESSYAQELFAHSLGGRWLSSLSTPLRRTHLARIPTLTARNSARACTAGIASGSAARRTPERQPAHHRDPARHGEQELRAAHPRVGHQGAARFDKRRATGVVYTDVTTGEEYEQPASIVALCAYAINNVP